MKSIVIDGVVWLLNEDGSLFATEESIEASTKKLAEAIDEDVFNHYSKESERWK